ncbi:amidohydrolase family protein [Sphaerochaeta sp. PS]|uniref:amidohydrolase family protein n=1 Tax=Sphaerochaeta sp. PS TaxID=3076336 RepID=UPI0028A44EF1|nr:amidohydrolase family protein [Sphaerochaeta sp. PS]MDT4763066.1 amidohydrolase family protein [Sphaerochaeta sp. PS]
MILKNATYLGPDHRLYTQDIRVSGSVISQIQETLEPEDKERIIDCSSFIVAPALADCHVHTPDTLLRGLFRDMPLASWYDDSAQGRLQQKLIKYIDNAVGKPEFKTLVLYAYMQHIRQGIAFIVETGQADNSSAILQECAQQIGLKALVDFYEEYPTNPAPTATISHGIHLPEEEDLTPEILEEVRQLCLQERPFLMTHCLETSWRRAQIEKKFGMSTIELLAKKHMLNKKSILFHCIEASEEDIKLLAQYKANVVHCPISNTHSGAGNMNIGSMLQQQINITLGTDYLSHDFWETMRATYGELKQGMKPNLYDARTVVDMATRNAEVFAGETGYQGTIEVGSGADLLFLNAYDAVSPLIDTLDFSNATHNLLTFARAEMITHVMIGGKWVLRNKLFVTIDEQEILNSYAELVNRLFPQAER